MSGLDSLPDDPHSREPTDGSRGTGFDTLVSALGRGALHLQKGLIDIYASLPKTASGHPRRFYPSGEPGRASCSRRTESDRHTQLTRAHTHRIRHRYPLRPRHFASWCALPHPILQRPANDPTETPHQNKLRTREHIEALAKEGKLEFTYIVTGPFLDTFVFARAGGAVGYDRQNGTYGIIGPENAWEQPTISGTTYADTGRCESKLGREDPGNLLTRPPCAQTS